MLLDADKTMGVLIAVTAVTASMDNAGMTDAVTMATCSVTMETDVAMTGTCVMTMAPAGMIVDVMKVVDRAAVMVVANAGMIAAHNSDVMVAMIAAVMMEDVAADMAVSLLRSWM
jgi:hypothetical protein